MFFHIVHCTNSNNFFYHSCHQSLVYLIFTYIFTYDQSFKIVTQYLIRFLLIKFGSDIPDRMYKNVYILRLCI